MKIRLQLSDLAEALNFASTVKPSNKEGNSAYLFTINDGKCYIHSQDVQYVRTEVPVSEIEGIENGSSFAYPADRVDALKYVKGWIEIEAGKDVDSDRYWINYRTENGAKSNRSTYNPRLFNTMEAALLEAATENTFPTILLKEGISITSRYMATEAPEPDSPLLTLQVFDKSNPDWAKGDGTMFAADGNRACFFHSPALAGKGLAVHSKHVSHLSAFLNKCHSTVKVKIGKMMTFVIDQVPVEGGVKDGAVFGWAHHSKMHSKYKYHPSKFDKFRLMVPKQIVLDTLLHIRSEMKDANRAKVRMLYSEKFLRFMGSVNKENTESAAVGVDPLPLDGDVASGPEFSANANVNYLIGLFEASRDHNVEFRVAFLDEAGKKAVFRTIGKVWVGDSGKSYTNPADAKEPCYECMVTHFSTSMD